MIPLPPEQVLDEIRNGRSLAATALSYINLLDSLKHTQDLRNWTIRRECNPRPIA